MAGAQFLDIVRRAAKGDRPRVMEPVADRGRTRHKAVNRDRDDCLAEHRDDPLQRTNPAQASRIDRGRPPAHRLWPGKAPHDPFDGLGEQERRRLSVALGDCKPHPVALGQLIGGKPGLAQEPIERLGRSRSARPLDLLALCRRRKRQTARDQPEPARGREGLDRFGGEPRLVQLLGQHPGKVVAGFGLHPGRNFLGQQFEQEIGRGARGHAVGSRHSTHFTQAAFARSRTRPM